ncbi:peptidoglycan bridge formation glycyltransferase FemA/FemB family protein [Catenisphaera adipataccumulans]|uniref:Lipid II:glycine glycyltransferase (Peptidoglycan interpeptide bridge formation enzyme) n=1 Tax=Catenisphaera adipataccumulans TaxID=700500 RepID=A0A7W8CWL6_9FIRM|nr:peptidoglycan bridge formation glycyltransferase FemA/FemB family protein [Catenisphaera adipataccumulans]MBB5182952.1 lipid II:glycine glycyltransferase (peptidoglycan interpeptide bridge formation enzyme) [Catenisphaera adipataccumulans]
MKFTELTEQEFDAFAQAYPKNNLWQSTEMAQMHKLRGNTIYYVGIKDNDTITAGAMISCRPVFRQYCMASAPRGFLIDYKDQSLLTYFNNELVRFLKKRHCIRLRIDPYIGYVQRDLDGNEVPGGWQNKDVYHTLISLGYTHEGFTRGIDMAQEPRWMYTIPYQGQTADQLLHSFERKTIRSIQKTEKYQIEVRELPYEELDLFMNVIKSTEERRHFTGRDKTYYENLYKVYSAHDHIKFLYTELFVDRYLNDLENDLAKQKQIIADVKAKHGDALSKKMRTKIHLAEEQIDGLNKKIAEAKQLQAEKGNAIPLAAGVFFTYGRETLCLMSGVYEEYMKFASPYAMHWYMMKKDIEAHRERYNLYGISGEFGEQADDYGVYLFKKGFNGEVIELIGVFDYVLNPFMNTMYEKMRRIKHHND